MKNIYIIGLLWACSTWTMADTVVNEKAVTAQQLAKANAIRVITRPESWGYGEWKFLIIRSVSNTIIFVE